MQRETPIFTLTLVNRQYYLVELKDDVEFGVPEMELLVQLERELYNQPLPVLVICTPTTHTDSDFANYLGRNANNPLSVADAFVIQSLPQKLLAHFYKVFVKPERPTAFFKKKDDALAWLKQFHKTAPSPETV